MSAALEAGLQAVTEAGPEPAANDTAFTDAQYIRALKKDLPSPEVAKHNARLEQIAARLEPAANDVAVTEQARAEAIARAYWHWQDNSNAIWFELPEEKRNSLREMARWQIAADPATAQIAALQAECAEQAKELAAAKEIIRLMEESEASNEQHIWEMMHRECGGILSTLASCGVCTPAETYGSDIHWAVSDIKQALSFWHKERKEQLARQALAAQPVAYDPHQVRDAARYRWLIENESRICSDFDEVAGERQQFVIEARFEEPHLDAETVGEFIDRQVAQPVEGGSDV